jgi:transcriptional regulator with XRE-family HTH domain
MTIGDKIRNLRKDMGLNQTELGERLGVKTNAVSKWECGRVEDIPMSKVKMMANLFDVPVSYLIDDDTDASIEKEQPHVVEGLSLEDVSPEDLKTIKAYLEMPEDQRRALAKILGVSE